MSVELVKREILRFLSNNEPEVLSISGEWGIGKTFCWKQYLGNALHQKKIALERYAYASLFGVNSLDELKYCIFENTVRTEEAAKVADLETFTSMLGSVENLSRKYAWLANLVPGLRTYFSAASPAFFLSVRNQIICIDDFERKGEKIKGKDVLGLVSFLKEQRSCKVALLLNSDALNEEQKEEFNKYLEKVVDTSLKFLPSPAESAQIALSEETEVNNLISEYTIALGISNIRIIRKIRKHVRDIEPLLKQYDKRVLRDAVQSLALFVWSHSAPEKALPLKYISERDEISSMADRTISKEKAAWNALLEAYGFRYMNELDKVLLDGVGKGFFDSEAIRKEASKEDEQVKANLSMVSLEQAWEPFHGAFSDNQEEVINTIHQHFLDNVRYISPMTMNGTVKLFKELGRSDLANEVIEYYLEKRGAEQMLFDLSHQAFFNIDDPDVVRAFKEKFDSGEQKQEPAEILVKLGHSKGWNSYELTTVSNMPVDGYYRVFKSNIGEELKSIIEFCLQFDRAQNATSEMKEISKRAREALQLIGQESNINALRVRKYGVE